MPSAELVYADFVAKIAEDRATTSVRPDGPDQRRPERRAQPAGVTPVTPT